MIKKILKSLGHALLLIVLHLFYFNLNWSVPLEYEMMMAMNKIESYMGGAGKFDESKCLFINTAYDETVIQSETEYGDEGTTIITDRELLAEFFEKMAAFGNQHQYILCDVLFDKPTENDSALAASFSKVKKIITPVAYSDHEKEIKKPLFNVKHAQADYITYEGLVSKIRLYAKESNTKTLPLVMFEDHHTIQTTVTKMGLFYKNSYIPGSIYPRYFFNREAIFQYEIRLKTIVDILKSGDTTRYNDLIKDKLIVIGNFTTDIHYTPLGSMPGSLILFNTYLTLEAKYHLLGWGWFVFALICFCILCYIEFVNKKERPAVTDRNWRTLLWHLLGVTGWCLVISLLSGLIYRVHITIIPVILYLEVFRHIRKIKLPHIKFTK